MRHFKKNALDDLEVVKGQYRNGMIEVQKTRMAR